MSKSAFDKIAAGMDDAIAFVEGDKTRARIAAPVDVEAIRTANNMTQAQFAETFCVPIGTLRDWEQKRRAPDTTGRVFLRMIAADPEGVKRILQRAEHA